MDLEFPNGIALDFHVKSTRCDESMTWSRGIALHSFTDCEIRGSVQLHRQRLREACGHVLHNQDRNWNFCGKDGKNFGKCERAAGRDADEKQFRKSRWLETFGLEVGGGFWRAWCLDY